MSVFIFKGGYELVKKSGVGKAIEHQEKALHSEGIEQAQSWKDKFDIIHINTVFPDSFFAALRAKIKRKKIVYYGHSTMEDFKNSFHFSNFFAPLFKFWIKRCYSLGDIIITPSPYSKNLLESYGIKKKIYDLTNGIDTNFFQYKDEYKAAFRKKFNLKEDEKVVISAGHFIARKGITDFVKMAEECPDITFIWFGESNLKLVPEEIASVVKHHPDNCHFPGFVNSTDLRNAYCGADCFMFLSREETEGIVVLEALACEIPTILRDIPVYDPWIVHRESAIKVNNKEETHAALAEILSSDNFDLKEGARKVAELKSIKSVGKQLRNIYEENFSVH